MRRILLPAILAAVVGLAYLPTQAHASVYVAPVYSQPYYPQAPVYAQSYYPQPPVCVTPAPVLVPRVPYSPVIPSYYVAPRYYSHYHHYHR